MNDVIHLRSIALIAIVITALAASSFAAGDVAPANPVMMPVIDGPWWNVAGVPDLGKYRDAAEEPIDFCIWQAADGTWQLLSCIRRTKCGGHGRLFHGWEGKHITDRDWAPQGIKMEADPALGEAAGGLQAPHVVLSDGAYHMLYGDWEHICLATSRAGKKFQRHLLPNGTTGIFTEKLNANTRDACAILVGNTWHVYYTAFPNDQGVVYCRTSPDLRTFSESTAVAFGGVAGVGKFAGECPHVIQHEGRYYLFRTQQYYEKNGGPRTCVYSSTDPLSFGINQDRLYYVGELPVAAPEIIRYEGQDFIAALLPNVKGIRVAKLGWRPKPK